MTDSDAVEALTDLGLSTYEARVFIALVRLGSGTAREVADIAEVPRPQVYTTTQELEERGFVSIKQSKPQVFRPVSLEEARRQLERQFENKRDTAFERLSSIEQQENPSRDDSEDVYSITGGDAISERIIQLISEAEDQVYYGAATLDDPEPGILDALQACCNRGVSVLILREHDQSLSEEWKTIDCLIDHQLPQEQPENEDAERMLLVDTDVFLLSIGGTDINTEAAIWSARTTFAAAFSQLLMGGFPDLEH
jgi:sugar-specific transcriptional regulator TrmB